MKFEFGGEICEVDRIAYSKSCDNPIGIVYLSKNDPERQEQVRRELLAACERAYWMAVKAGKL